jgi:hypothetical protein
LRRNLQPMEMDEIIIRKESRRTKSKQMEEPYYLNENIEVFKYIMNQIAKEVPSDYEKFLSSSYTNNMIKEFLFPSVFKVLEMYRHQNDFKIAGSKSLLNPWNDHFKHP